MGYLLSVDTSQQKFFVFVGPKRSGKGTILKVIGDLIGPAGFTSTTLQQLGLSSGFGLEGLIGRSVCAVPDASLSGRTDAVVVAEVLKSISGEDPVAVGRKYKTPWIGQLKVRFVLAANEVLSLQDRSGALASRMILLQFEHSFYGREDKGLLDRLRLEKASILNWALEGLKRLAARGHFVQTETGQESVNIAAELGSPMIAFFNYWVPDRDGQ